MFERLFCKKEPSPTDVELERLYAERAYYEPTGDEYQKLNARIKELLELRKLENEPRGGYLSKDTKAKVAGMTILGTLVVFKEQLLGPITSKAIGIVTKIL